MLISTLYDWGGLNRELFSAVNGFRGPLIDALMLAGTQLGDISNAAWIALVLLLLIIGRRALARTSVVSCLPDERIVSDALFVFVLGCAIAALIVFAGKVSFDMPRPYIALPSGSVNVLVDLKEPYSFPSGHSALAALTAWVFWPYCQKRWRLILLFCVIWVGLSRVSLGAHFPADVVAGYICGGLSGWLATRVLTIRGKGRSTGKPAVHP